MGDLAPLSSDDVDALTAKLIVGSYPHSHSNMFLVAIATAMAMVLVVAPGLLYGLETLLLHSLQFETNTSTG